MSDQAQARNLKGLELRTTQGDRIGKIGAVYVDDQSDAPEWVTVNTGLFGTRESFVPLVNAERVEDGLVVPYSKKQIKDAPGAAEDKHLDEEQEQALYEHYGVPYLTDGSTFADTSQLGAGRGTTGRHVAEGDRRDDAMTRSEQRLDVGTERVETGRARLRKWVEEENVRVEVPITREKARLVSEPVTDGNRDDALSGPDLSESEHEVTLTEERPVISKETVPVERVRLETDRETDVRQVEETVGKERIEIDGDVDERAGRDRR